MAEYNVQQKQFIQEYKAQHKLTNQTDEQIMLFIQKDMQTNGVVYPGFEHLAKPNTSASSTANGQIFDTSNKPDENKGISVERSSTTETSDNLSSEGKEVTTDENGNTITTIKDGDDIIEQTISSTDEKGNNIETVVNYQDGKPIKKTKKKNFLNKHARMLSVITTYIIALLVCIIIINVILPAVIQSLKDLISNIPNYYNTAVDKINSLPENHILRNERVIESISKLKDIDVEQLINLDKIQSYIKGVISAVGTIFDIFISIVVSVYILLQRKQLIQFWSKLVKTLVNEKTYIKLKKYFIKGNEIFFNFLTSQIIDAIVVGVLVSIAMLIIGVKYAVLLGFVIGLFNLIPYFGALVAVAISILITLFTDGIGKAILMAIIVIVLQQIDANIINPKIIGNSLKISQLLVLFAVTVGGAYFGILGMFLAVPVFTVIKVIIEDYIDEKTGKE